MKIPILERLESRQQWLTFSAQETAYAYVQQPLTLLDLQSSFLQITIISDDLRDGREAIKYSLGSKLSSTPAWTLIESFKWSLSAIIKGLAVLNFDSNVRDNSLLIKHSELSMRQFFAKDKCVISPLLLLPLLPLEQQNKPWNLQQVQQLLLNEQYSALKWLTKTPPSSANALVLQLISYPNSWKVIARKDTLLLMQHDKYIVQFVPRVNEQKITKTLALQHSH